MKPYNYKGDKTANPSNKMRCLLEEHIHHVVRQLLCEAQEADITKSLRSYLRYSQMGEMGSSRMSISASELHSKLMSMIGLDHQDVRDRKCFSYFLRIAAQLYSLRDCGLRITTEGDGSVTVYVGGEKKWYYLNDDDMLYRPNDGVVYETYDGIVEDEVEKRPGASDGYTGRYTLKAHMTGEMIQRIRDMGLVPALMVTGSYHENFLSSVGILPSMVGKLRDRSDVNFDCSYVEFKS